MIDAHYPGGGWIRAAASETLERAAPLQARAGPALLRRGARAAAGERRLDERRASSSTRCSTRATRSIPTRRARPRTRRRRRSASSTRRPTPRRNPHVEARCASRSCSSTGRGRDASRGAVRFLQASGERHQGVERALELAPAPLERLAAEEPLGREFSFDGGRSAGGGRGCAPSGSARASPGSGSASTTRPSPMAAGLERPAALRSSLLSTHVVAARRRRALRSRRSTPTGRTARRWRPARTSTPCRCSPRPSDDAVLGAAIVPARPPADRAREPRQPLRQHRDRGGAAAARAALSEAERARDRRPGPEGARDDRARRGGRAPEEIARPARAPGAGPPARLGEPAGDGRRRRRSGAARRRHPATPQARRRHLRRVLAGRAATIERIYVDYEDGVHLGVTVDDDPGQELMRDVRPLPVLQTRGSRAAMSANGKASIDLGGQDVQAAVDRMEARMSSPEREKQILVAGVGNALLADDGFGGEVAKRPGRARAAARGHRDGLRHRRPRPRLRGDARLRRAGDRRRQPPGRRAGHAVRDRARRSPRSRAGSRTAR